MPLPTTNEINAYTMRRFLIYLLVLPILCTSCWYLEYVDPYPSVPHPDYKSVMYYTTTDGMPINITNPDSFGIDIIDMTYANGEGVITFDGIARHIGYKAFRECDNLKSVILPDSIRIIEEEAFSECGNLENVLLPKNLKSIGRDAFSHCTKLTSIYIPESVGTLSSRIFMGCESLREFKGGLASEDGRTIIYDNNIYAFAPAGLTEYRLPEGAKRIIKQVFAECNNLTSVTIPAGYDRIGRESFYGCTSLESVIIEEGVYQIDILAFANCTSLMSVYLKTNRPPRIHNSTFAKYYNNTYDSDFIGCDFYVPEELVVEYQRAEYWKEYKEHIHSYNFE